MTESFGGFFEDAEKGGGGGLPGAASFDFKGNVSDGIGLSVAGEIVDVYESQQTEIDPPHDKKVDKNGKPMMQLAVTLQTDLRDWAGAKKPWEDSDGNKVEDTGLRKVYLRFQGARAVGDAVKAAGATFDDFLPNIGALLYLKRIENDGKMNQFEAKFKPGTKKPESSAESFFEGAGSATPEASSASTDTSASPWGDTSTTPTSTPSTDEPPF